MAPPANYTDFYELELQINYNNSPNPYLQTQATTGIQPPEERQAGWTERYNLFLPTPPNGTNLPMQNAYTLVQARAALLGLNYYIKRAVCHQASVFKSSWPMPGSAKYPLWDGKALTSGLTATQLCSSPEETAMLRMETSNLRRWEYQIRGLKDYVSDDAMSYFAATSYADAATFATTSVFDSLQQTIPPAGLTGASPAQVTYTLTGSSLASLTLVSGGSYPQVANGTYYAYVYSANGLTVPALATVTITGNTVTAVGLTASPAGYGQGYQGTTGYIPVSNDCNTAGTIVYGMPNYLTPQIYWANMLSCLISFTQSGTTKRIANSTYTAPVPSFPSGFAQAMLTSTLGKANRALFQRVGNRQTGQIRVTKKARVKRGI